MRSQFVLQQKDIYSRIWHEPEPSYGEEYVTRADNASELRTAIQYLADHYTSTLPTHYRIITHHGNPVERWKVRAGRARKTWRKQ